MCKGYILAINPGSTSTKIALYKGEESIAVENLSHSPEEIAMYDSIYLQKDMREEVILNWLKSKNVDLNEIQAIVGRGGLLRPMPGGTYKVTPKMIEDLKAGYQGQHASNLGGIIAFHMANRINVPAFIVDPVAVDEMDDIARISGMLEIPRRSLVHALNIKAVTRRVCERTNKDFYNSSFIVAHLGGGISVAPLKDGRIIDVNNANEDGPFSPERSGGLPVGDMVKMAFSGEYTQAELKKMIIGKSGFVGYLGTNDGREVSKRMEKGDKKAEFILYAMAYQIAKEIGAMATVLNGKVDAIVLTGGLAYNEKLTGWIKEMVGFISPIELVPGEDEMLALSQGALRILKGEERAKIYEEEVHING
ncbi:butyrate kinase [Clostridium sp. MSJ-4]|uniref:Probable butyrate kinase n=1 Tax=Clostridium simiarum TaxID=2841506 RepID=A0ABS6EZY3_9CLOT|nr:butyrate kinase [Clostridium simiarum]MBU5591809.1 butyrate kinase [Clostridium simiarum]